MTHTVSLSTSGITSLTKALIYNDHTPPRKYFLVLIFNKMIGMTHETNPWINESNWSTCWFIFSCGPPTWVIFVWVLSPSCPHRSYLWYWWKSSGSSIIFMGHYDEQSWDLSSLLAMEICDQDLGGCFLANI